MEKIYENVHVFVLMQILSMKAQERMFSWKIFI